LIDSKINGDIVVVVLKTKVVKVMETMLLAITSFNNLSKKGEISLKRTIESILKAITSFYNYRKDVKLGNDQIKMLTKSIIY